MGTFLGIIALLVTLVAFTPLLGILNWITIPISVVLLIVCAIIQSSTGKKLCTVAIVVGIIRLIIGGGIF